METTMGLERQYIPDILEMEKKMETTIVYWGYIRVILVLYRDNGKRKWKLP